MQAGHLGFWLAVALAWTTARGAQKVPTLAILADRQADPGVSSLVAVLEARLSQGDGVHLLERAAIDKVLQEQQMSVAGLVERDAMVRAGRLVRADAFVLLSLEGTTESAPQGVRPGDRTLDELGGGEPGVPLSKEDLQPKGQLLRVRVVETAHGLRLWDGYEPLEGSEVEAAAGRITEKVRTLMAKVGRPAGQVIPIGIVDIHRVQLPETYERLVRVLPGLLSSRLGHEPRILMLEREDLGVLLRERQMTEGEDAAFWGSAVLIDGTLQPAPGKGLKASLRLRRGSGEAISSFDVWIDVNAPAAAVGKASVEITKVVLKASLSTQWDPEREAEEFYRQGELLSRHGRHEAGTIAFEAAHAMDADDVRYTAALFMNEWWNHPLVSIHSRQHYAVRSSEQALAELASVLVRQVDRDFERGALSARDVYDQQWALALGMDINFGPMSYLTSSVSVSTEEIRRINKENRGIWVRTLDKALRGQAMEKDHRQTSTRDRARLVWVSSDDPEELIANLERSISEFVLPPPSGGQIKSAEDRASLFQQAFYLHVADPCYVDMTHLAGSGGKFLEMWMRYMNVLAQNDDPIVRSQARRALASRPTVWTSPGETPGARPAVDPSIENARGQVDGMIDDLRRQLAGADESVDPVARRQAITDLGDFLRGARPAASKVIEVLEEVGERLIEDQDVDGLVLLDPGWRPFSVNPPWLDAGAAGRYHRLLERMATVLQPRQGTANALRTLSRMRDFQAEIRSRYPELGLRARSSERGATMLLSRRHWRDAWGSDNRQPLVEILENTLWMALASRSGGRPKREGTATYSVQVGLAGIDLAQGTIDAQMEWVSLDHSAELTDMARCGDALYLSIRNGGLIEIPDALLATQGSSGRPRLLAQGQGLPSLSLTGLASDGKNLWVAYGGLDQESGLGLYRPDTGQWTPILCSTLKGDPPFNAGQPYELYSLMGPLRDELLFALEDPRHSASMEQWIGLWSMDAKTHQVRHLGYCGVRPSRSGRIEVDGERLWCKGSSSFMRFDPHSTQASYILGSWPMPQASPTGPRWLAYGPDLFVPEAGLSSIPFGPTWGGLLDLSTAAIHGNTLWACLGKSQIAMLRRGRPFEEAEIIPNDILDGEPVVWFVSTPYGLIGIGDCTVGLIEDAG